MFKYRLYIILLKVLFFKTSIFSMQNLNVQKYNLTDMPEEIILKIMDYFNFQDPEYCTLKEMYLSLFSKRAITKEVAQQSVILFYEKTLANCKNTATILQRLINKYNSLNKDFIHYKIINDNYINILKLAKELNYKYNMLYDKIILNIEQKRFNEIDRILAKHILRRDEKQQPQNYSNTINNLQDKTCLKLLENNVKTFFINKVIKKLSFKFWSIYIFCTIGITIISKKYAKTCLFLLPIGMLGIILDSYILHYKFYRNKLINKFKLIS